MSTNAILAFDQGRDFEGVYLHSDGYPTHTLVVLGELYKVHGAAKVIKTLTTKPGWSELAPGMNELRAWHVQVNRQRKEFELVLGFGVAYVKDTDHPTPALTKTDASSYSWTYSMNFERVKVFRDGRAVAVIHWGAITPYIAQEIEREWT